MTFLVKEMAYFQNELGTHPRLEVCNKLPHFGFLSRKTLTLAAFGLAMGLRHNLQNLSLNTERPRTCEGGSKTLSPNLVMTRPAFSAPLIHPASENTYEDRVIDAVPF